MATPPGKGRRARPLIYLASPLGFSETSRRHVLPVLKKQLEAIGADVYGTPPPPSPPRVRVWFNGAAHALAVQPPATPAKPGCLHTLPRPRPPRSCRAAASRWQPTNHVAWLLPDAGAPRAEPFATNLQNGLGPASGRADWAFDIAYADRDAVIRCDAIFAVINGLPPDEGAWVHL